MLKNTLGLLVVLFVSATNARLTPEELGNYERQIELDSIEGTKNYIKERFDNATEEYEKLVADAREKRILMIENEITEMKNFAALFQHEIKALEDEVTPTDKEKCAKYKWDFGDEIQIAKEQVTTCMIRWIDQSADIFDNYTGNKNKFQQDMESASDLLISCGSYPGNDFDRYRCMYMFEQDITTRRSRFDVLTDSTILVSKYLYENIEKSYNICRKGYGSINFFKYGKDIVEQYGDCLKNKGE